MPMCTAWSTPPKTGGSWSCPPHPPPLRLPHGPPTTLRLLPIQGLITLLVLRLEMPRKHSSLLFWGGSQAINQYAIGRNLPAILTLVHRLYRRPQLLRSPPCILCLDMHTRNLQSRSPAACVCGSTCSRWWQGGVCREERYEAEVQEALVASKLDAIGAEYSARIQSQLEEQRKFFEGRISATTADFESRLAATGEAAAAAQSAAADCKSSATESSRLRSISEAKLVLILLLI